MKTVFIAGATGYLGRHLCAEYRRRGWHVLALVRDIGKARDLDADRLLQGEATDIRSLRGLMDGAELVISALGITRQADGLGYWEVDFQANLNLLAEARRARVPGFGYIHVFNAQRMAHVPMVAAKSAFVRALQDSDIESTVIAPTGFFSDMNDILAMARNGRVWLFGSGAGRINPIHGADLAEATADAIAAKKVWLNVGGPDVFRQSDLARTAIDVAGNRARIIRLPDWLRHALLVLLPRLTPRRVHGPAQFFLTALGLDMVGDRYGTHHLRAHFAALAEG